LQSNGKPQQTRQGIASLVEHSDFTLLAFERFTFFPAVSIMYPSVTICCAGACELKRKAQATAALRASERIGGPSNGQFDNNVS
jgi:hypothetical protein